MRLYLTLLAFLFALAICFKFDGAPELQAKYLWPIATRKRRLGVVAVALILISGLRRGVGTDFPHYVVHFNALAIGEESGSNFEFGFNLLNRALSFFGFSDQWLFLVLGCILVILITKSAYDYSEHPEMSMFLFVSLYFYFSSFNIVRQYVAVPIMLYATKYIMQKRLVPYMVCVLLASSFHYSALIMIPFYFIADIRIKQIYQLILIAFGVAIALFGRPVIAFVITLFPRYSVYFDMPAGSAWFDLAVMVGTYGLLVFTHRKAKKCLLHRLYVNAMLVGILFALLTFANILFARIMPYFYIFAILAIPHALKNTLLGKKQRHILSIGVCAFACMICVYYLLNNNGGVIPYS